MSRSRLACLALLLGMALQGGGCRDGPAPVASDAQTTTGARASPSPPRKTLLERGDLDTERFLSPGATHLYSLELAAGHFLHVEIDQRGSDVFARLLDGRGEVLVEVDSHTGTEGDEHLYHVVAETGSHTLAVQAFDSSPAGAYVAKITAERPASPRDRRRTAAEKAFADAYALAEKSPEGKAPEAALAGYERAARLFGELGEESRQGHALYELAKLHDQAGRNREAIDPYRRSILLLSAPADRRLQGVAWNELALAWRSVGNPRQERHCLERALTIAREVGDRREEATASSNLARLENRLGRPLEALELYRRATDLWRALGDRLQLAGTLRVVGEVYTTLGETELALDHQRRSLELLDPRAEPLERATTLSFIGWTLLEAGDLDGAAAAYGETLALRRESGDEAGRAKAWSGLGLIEERRGNPRRAMELYRQALAVFERREVLLDQAHAVNNLAWLYLKLGEAEQALELHGRALALYRRLGHQRGEATSLLGQARARRLLGDDGAALDAAEAALAAMERVLGSGQAPAARDDISLPYHASRQDFFDLYIELLVAEHHRRPEAGYDALALAAAEQARARHLLESLAWEPGGRPETALAARRRDLRDQINAADLRLRRLLPAAPQRPAAERRQRLRLAEYHRLTQRIREEGSWASLEQPRPLAVAEMQALLGDDTLLLEFHLGEERSFLWAATADTLELFELPPRHELESLARRAHALLTESDRITHRVPAERALRELAGALLAPAAERLDGQRLLVVAGGALEYVPFAALPLPARKGRRLVEEHEIVHLPSASVLAVLRRQAALHPPREGLMAVLADPVFGPGDERLDGRAAESREIGLGLGPFGRLSHSRREAEAILALADGAGPVLAALGFDAHRELVTGGRLAGYRILHFATHGLLHPDHPELSSLVLSRYHPDGRAREGRLPLYALHDLRLPADLVVLSACRTALGEEARGEGLLGLPRGFFRAGASRVLVSLWSVQDESTAELMTRFYRHLLRDELPAAAALAAAQRSMLAEPRYSPYHWAGFVLQGDWR